MTIGPPAQCLYCARFRLPMDGHPERTCDAFPGGIPPVIWANRFDHRQPFEGDHGLRWKPDVDGGEYPPWAVRKGGGGGDEGQQQAEG